VFRVTGGLSKIAEVFQYAYMQWLPSSGYEMAYPFDFELYGEDYKGDVPESELDIYIPVRPKTGE
jgi:AraC family transcriptional regulator